MALYLNDNSDNMNKLIKSVYHKWRKAKANAEKQCRIAGLIGMADKLKACKMFTGEETLPELIDKMFSPQGREFMTRFGFPDIVTFRKFIPYQPEQYGVFIDAQEITLTDISNVYLIGNTSAYLKFAKTQGNTVVLMHGASADIHASGYSVVKVERDRNSKVNIERLDKAIVSL